MILRSSWLFAVLALATAGEASATNAPGIRSLGLGYNLRVELVDAPEWPTRFAPELAAHPGLSRVFCALDFMPEPGVRDWSAQGFQRLLRLLAPLQAGGHQVFLTMVFWGDRPGWLGRGAIDAHPDILAAWARAQADFIEELVVRRGFTCVKWWCFTNELDAGDGHFDDTRIASSPDGSTIHDPWRMPAFATHHRAVHAELVHRGLADTVGLVAPDALGRVDAWRASLPYVVNHLASAVAAYSVHDYAHRGTWAMNDPDTGAWTEFADETVQDAACGTDVFGGVLNRYRYATGLVAPAPRPFLLAELGVARADIADTPAGRHDAADWHPDYGLALADRIVAAYAAGMAGVSIWHYEDFDIRLPGGWTYHNQWGAWTRDPYGQLVARPHHSLVLLLSRSLVPGSLVRSPPAPGPHVRMLVATTADQESWIIVNRSPAPVTVPVPAARATVQQWTRGSLVKNSNVAIPFRVPPHTVAVALLPASSP